MFFLQGPKPGSEQNLGHKTCTKIISCFCRNMGGLVENKGAKTTHSGLFNTFTTVWTFLLICCVGCMVCLESGARSDGRRWGGINQSELGAGRVKRASQIRGLTQYFLPEKTYDADWKEDAPPHLSVSLSRRHCLSLWPPHPSCQHPSTLLTLIAIGVTPCSVPYCVIDFISAPFYIKTRSLSLLSPHPSHQELIRDTRWNVPVATRQDIMTTIKGGGS